MAIVEENEFENIVADDVVNILPITKPIVDSGITFESIVTSTHKNSLYKYISNGLNYSQFTGGYYNNAFEYDEGNLCCLLWSPDNEPLGIYYYSRNQVVAGDSLKYGHPPIIDATLTNKNGIIYYEGGTYDNSLWIDTRSISSSGTDITFVVNTNQDFIDWHNNVGSNNYNHVYINTDITITGWDGSAGVGGTEGVYIDRVASNNKIIGQRIGTLVSIEGVVLSSITAYAGTSATQEEYRTYDLNTFLSNTVINGDITVYDYCDNNINCTGNCTGTGFGAGFEYCNNNTNCTGISTSNYGFFNCDNNTNCTGSGNSSGFRNCTNNANCIGTGIGGNSSGFGSCTNNANCISTGTLGFSYCNNNTNCTGTGDGAGNFGFTYCDNNTNCTGISTGAGSGFGNCDNNANCIGSGNGWGFSDCAGITACKGTNTNVTRVTAGNGFYT